MSQQDSIYSKSVVLISKEAGLAASCIERGLTVLRKANFAQKWNYYQAFFLLTIGVERLLKLTIITSSRIEYNKLPDNGVLKSYGHNIEKLFISISSHLNPSGKFLDSDNIYKQILVFLSEYASTSRYYNLDSLSGIEKTTDPLHKWKNIQTEIAKRHCKPVQLTDSELYILNQMKSSASVLHTDESDTPITDFGEFYIHAKNLDQIQSYSVFYVYQIIRYLVDQLNELSNKVYMMPVLSEFFALFPSSSLTKDQILSRKDWNYLTNLQ